MSVYWKIIFLFLNQNICCGYSKEQSQWDGSFEHPKHMFKLMGKEINAIFGGAQTILILSEPMLKACLKKGHHLYGQFKHMVGGTVF